MRILILMVVLVCLQSSCKKKTTVVTASFSVRPVAGSQQYITHLSQDAGLLLSGGARVLYADDGGGSEPKYDFMEWVLFDPQGFDLSNLKDKTTLLSVTDTFVRDKFGSRISHLSGTRLDIKETVLWENAGFLWKILIVKANEGEYLFVSRMKQQ